MNLRLAVGGGAVVASQPCLARILPPLSSGSYFWTTSPVVPLPAGRHWRRVGVAGVLRVGRGCRAAAGVRSPSSGRTSLFIYWIHVELVYGLISLPLHRALSLPQACVAYVAFCGLDAGVLDRERARGRTLSRSRGPRPASRRLLRRRGRHAHRPPQDDVVGRTGPPSSNRTPRSDHAAV